jgi:RNA polymerase sigma factor FliA
VDAYIDVTAPVRAVPRNSATFSAVPQPEDIEVADYLPLVQHIVRDVAMRLPAHVDRDALLSAGNYALVTAMRAYDPATGVPFNAYASTRIRGALLDELRQGDWATRGARSKIRSVETAREQLATTLGLQPSTAEIAEHLDVKVAEVHRASQDERRSKVNSLEFLQEAVGFDAPSTGLSPEDEAMHSEQVRYLYAAVSLLPERTRQIIEAYFFEMKSMTEIAEEIGRDYSRVRQIINDALVRMRDAISQSDLPPSEGVAARRRAEYNAEVQHLAQSNNVALMERYRAAAV